MTYSGARRNPCKADQYDWTEERIALVTKLWGDGLSGSLIADQLGVTRNTVMGKIHRLGLGRLRGSVSGQTITSKPRGYRSHQRPRQARTEASSPFKLDVARFLRDVGAEVDLPPALPSVTAVFLQELEPHHCRWPYGEPRAALYCGADKLNGHSYCLGHCRMAYMAPKPRTVRHWQERRVA